MAKKRTLKSWTSSDEKTLSQLVKDGVPTTKIAKQLGRSTASVRSKAQKRSLSLKVSRKTVTAKAKKPAKRASK